jgi:hypothetical protein
MSFLVIVFLHSLLRRLGNQFAGEAFLSGVNGGKSRNVSGEEGKKFLVTKA